MTGTQGIGGKRELLARFINASGIAFLLEHLPPRDSLVVLNYHRIGNPDESPFDPGMFSATAEELDDQVRHLKRRMSMVTLEEALAFIDGNNRHGKRTCRVLLTFDDGYLDNYQIAFPILRAHGVQGVFFLPTAFVGADQLPWWDVIAYMVRTAAQRRFALRYPVEREFDLDQGLARGLRGILALYKRADTTDSDRFLDELQQACGGKRPSNADRCFLNWDEAREMVGGGMAVGSHTHTHQVLSQLAADKQLQELERSRALLSERLGVSVDTLAYPVGHPSSFTNDTQSAAKTAGYRAAFSFYGGANFPRQTHRYNVLRLGVSNPSRSRFRVQTAIARRTGHYWP